jgi:hypothetical protein
MNNMVKLINRIGFFRILYVPIGIAIIISAIVNGIIGMGIVGGIILVFGILNKCILMGQCELPETQDDLTLKNKSK